MEYIDLRRNVGEILDGFGYKPMIRLAGRVFMDSDDSCRFLSALEKGFGMNISVEEEGELLTGDRGLGIGQHLMYDEWRVADFIEGKVA